MRNLKPIDPTPEELDVKSFVGMYNMAKNEDIIFDAAESSSEKLKFPGYEKNKEAIRVLADGCCSYCGLRINGTNTETVEHYRPKARLDFRINEVKLDGLELSENNRTGKFDIKPEKCDYGYFLWGDDFNNLMPSCEACNTGQAYNKICIATKEDPGNCENKIPYGKKNFFPIYYNKKNEDGMRFDHRENKRYISDITGEIPLLFNPYIDDPDEIFTYKGPYTSNNSSIIKIRPNPFTSKINRLKAEVSINLLGLNRDILCTYRFNKLNSLSGLDREIKGAIKDSNYDIVLWAKFANTFASEFDTDSSQLLGFGKRLSAKLVFELREVLVSKFSTESNGVLSESLDFGVMVRELFEFHKEVKRLNNIDENINNMMMGIVNR